MPPIWNPNPSGLCLRPSVLWTLPTCVQTPLPLFSRWSPASEVSRLLHDFTLLLLPGIPLLLLPALIPHPHPTQQTPVSEFLSVTPSCFYPLFHKWNHHTLLLSCCLCPSLSPLTVSLAPTPLLPQAKENRVVCPPLRLFHSEPLRDRRSPHSLPPTVGFLTTCTSIWINEQGHIFDQWDYVFMKNWSGIKL